MTDQTKSSDELEQTGSETLGTGRFVRLNELGRAKVNFFIDGHTATGLEGDTLLVAILNAAGHVRHSEFGDGVRAGFCLMGACQDCWIWTEEGDRLRACTTLLEPDLRVLTKRPEEEWLQTGS